MINVNHQPVMNLLNQCPVYAATPLQKLDANLLGPEIGTVWAKNEGHRMGLGSFKALGGSFAILSLLMEKAGLAAEEQVSLDDPALVAVAAKETFVCATAGNHGLAVAAAARLFGGSAVVYIAETVPASFEQRLLEKGARVVRQGAAYEDALAAAMDASNTNGWQLVADTSWPGYEKVPGLIYQGYSALAEECRARFAEQDHWPQRVLLQAGVGGLAAAVAAHIRHYWPRQPEILVVEPDAAPCLQASMEAGRLTRVEGPVSTMGRLDCKEASMLTFDSLSRTADRFITISDQQAEQASSILTDAGLSTTPSGAAGLAALLKEAQEEDFQRGVDSLVIISETG